ncbi:MAG: DNA polymerase [Flavonifractor plautii]
MHAGSIMRSSCPCAPCWPEMERAGMLVDRKALSVLRELLDQRHPAGTGGSSMRWPGRSSTFYSTQQLGHILFDKLGLPPVKKTKTGYSTNAEVLEKLRAAPH